MHQPVVEIRFDRVTAICRGFHGARQFTNSEGHAQGASNSDTASSAQYDNRRERGPTGLFRPG